MVVMASPCPGPLRVLLLFHKLEKCEFLCDVLVLCPCEP